MSLFYKIHERAEQNGGRIGSTWYHLVSASSSDVLSEVEPAVKPVLYLLQEWWAKVCADLSGSLHWTSQAEDKGKQQMNKKLGLFEVIYLQVDKKY